jgi:glycosyltransferase involved in cell wall biosynthesis
VKRLGDLVELARLLPEVPFVVIGPDRVPGAPDNLRAVGWVSLPSDVIRRSSVFVSTSAYEGSSNACLEALAVGTPVVTYDSAGGRELASTFPGSVQLVPVGDIDGLVTATEKALAQPVDITVDVPSVETVTDQWLSLLRAANSTA